MVIRWWVIAQATHRSSGGRGGNHEHRQWPWQKYRVWKFPCHHLLLFKMSVRPDANFSPVQDTRPAGGWLKVSGYCSWHPSSVVLFEQRSCERLTHDAFIYLFLSYCSRLWKWPKVLAVLRDGSFFWELQLLSFGDFLVLAPETRNAANSASMSVKNVMPWYPSCKTKRIGNIWWERKS